VFVRISIKITLANYNYNDSQTIIKVLASISLKCNRLLSVVQFPRPHATRCQNQLPPEHSVERLRDSMIIIDIWTSYTTPL